MMLSPLRIKTYSEHNPLLFKERSAFGCTSLPIITKLQNSEIHTSVNHHRPVARGSSDAPEIRTIDAEIGGYGRGKIGMVQDIVDIHSKLEFLRFCKPHSLGQIHVQADFARSLDPFQSKIAKLAGRRIDQKKPALRIRNGTVAELALESLRIRHTP